MLLPPQASGTTLTFMAFACSFALSDVCPILLKSTKSGELARQSVGKKLTPHYKKYINRVLMLVKVCEFAALGALCAVGVTLPILQLHRGSHPKLLQILGVLPKELNIFQVVNTLPLYHICIATAESHFFLFSKKMPVAEIKMWDAAFGALLIVMEFWTVGTPCTIFQELLDVKNPKNIAARKVFAEGARKRGKKVGLAHVKNSTSLWNVFHPILVAAGAINWGEIQGPRNVKESTGLFAPENQAKVRAGQRKGGNTKMGEGKTKVS